MSSMRWMVVLAAVFLMPALSLAQENNFQQGLEALANRDYDLAISCFNEEIRQHPRQAAAFANRGNAHAGKGDYEKAIVDFNQAIRLNPSDSHAYGNRGYAYDVRVAATPIAPRGSTSRQRRITPSQFGCIRNSRWPTTAGAPPTLR